MSRLEYQGASSTAIQGHYDLSNEFFALWLDESRTYSCALWDGPKDDLVTAQARKLDYLAAQALGSRRERVLDVGCGWGSMLRRLNRQHGVAKATGLTLSDAQAEYVNANADDGHEAIVENWADHRPTEPYDAIISIGAFEHFASFGMPRPERVGAYRAFFGRCAEWLEPGSRLAVQTITKGSNTKLDRKTTRDMLFIVDRIFTESELPWTSEILEASERKFDLVAARNDPEHYSRTCNEWLDTLQARREEAVAEVGADAVAEYERYLAASASAFDNRHVGLARFTFIRI